jgi:hypothetical protein
MFDFLRYCLGGDEAFEFEPFFPGFLHQTVLGDQGGTEFIEGTAGSYSQACGGYQKGGKIEYDED